MVSWHHSQVAPPLLVLHLRCLAVSAPCIRYAYATHAHVAPPLLVLHLRLLQAWIRLIRYAFAAPYAYATLHCLICYAYATCACCNRFCQSFMSPASPRGCTPDIRFCTHRLRCQYLTFVLVKQVLLY